MVTQDRQFPLSTPLSTFLTLIFIWSRWVVGNGDVDDGVLSSFLTLIWTFIWSRAVYNVELALRAL